jgi:hypothetical protein
MKWPDLGEVRGPGQQQHLGPALLQPQAPLLRDSGYSVKAPPPLVPLVRQLNGGRMGVGRVEAAMGRQPGC